MAAISTYPYDEAIARRATLEDLGGDQKIDDVNAPPGVGEPEAGAWNNFARLHAAASRMLPSVRLGVIFVAAAPVIETIVSMRNGTLTASDFAFTENGTGDTTITWAEGLLPAQAQAPRAFVNGSTPALITALAPTALSVRVITLTHAGSAVDQPFTLEIG